jgi:hypothetical protein
LEPLGFEASSDHSHQSELFQKFLERYAVVLTSGMEGLLGKDRREISR